MKRPRLTPSFAVFAAVLALFASCGSGESSATFERRGQSLTGRPDWVGTSATSEQRFGTMSGTRPATRQPSAPQFEYDLPEG
ncbi:MAG: hypothetical protein KDB61_15835, partial [Planctomycetes bacterium]|nr:hypothetical protein [Planctomycetota bacterium]